MDDQTNHTSNPRLRNRSARHSSGPVITDAHRQTGSMARSRQSTWERAFGYPRNFLNNQFVYLVLSPRARGLSIGVNLTPDRRCNFQCVYCEINRNVPPRAERLDIHRMIHELAETLKMAYSPAIRKVEGFDQVPEELLTPRHVAISGDGEPTLCPQFQEAIDAVTHLRALGEVPFFKIVLVTNATALQRPAVQAGISTLTLQDELWLKLDTGTPEHFARINRPKGVTYEEVLENIRMVGRQRPIIIQSLFPRFHGQGPSEEEIQAYVQRLRELKKAGTQIQLVQIYSAHRPMVNPFCEHLPLPELSRIAAAVRSETGLPAEVY